MSQECQNLNLRIFDFLSKMTIFDPKMAKIETTVQGSRLMNQNSDYTVSKKPKNDHWTSELVFGSLTVTEQTDQQGLISYFTGGASKLLLMLPDPRGKGECFAPPKNDAKKCNVVVFCFWFTI